MKREYEEKLELLGKITTVPLEKNKEPPSHMYTESFSQTEGASDETTTPPEETHMESATQTDDEEKAATMEFLAGPEATSEGTTPHTHGDSGTDGGGIGYDDRRPQTEDGHHPGRYKEYIRTGSEPGSTNEEWSDTPAASSTHGRGIGRMEALRRLERTRWRRVGAEIVVMRAQGQSGEELDGDGDGGRRGRIRPHTIDQMHRQS